MGVMDRYKNSKKNKENSTENATPKLGVKERYEANRVTTTQPSKETSFTFSEEGKSGWQKYLDDQEEKGNAPKYDVNNNGKDDWWEKVIGRIGEGSVDTTLPTAGVTQTINDLRADESYRRPTTDWTDEQRDAFGKLYLESPTTAFNFAEETNKTIKEAKEKAETEKIQDSATSSFGAGLGNTIGAIATAPFGMADFLYDLALSNAGREIAPDGYISPFEYSQAVTGGISQDLNETYGTLDEAIPIIGGKGWGDVYGLGTSIAQSALSGLALGGGGTLVSYFGQGAAAGVDEALSRGASEDQALLYGTLLGTFEGVAEMIGIDNLFKIGSSATLKEALKNVLKQAGAEGLEEGLTSVLGNVADAWVMKDKSNINLRANELVAQGMSLEDAKNKAVLEAAGDVLFDILGGAVSGGVHAGVATGIQTTANNIQNQKNFGTQAQAMADEAAASQYADVKAVGEKYQQKLADNKKLSGWNITELVETTDAAKVKSAVEAQLTNLGESGNISEIASAITKQTQGYDLTAREKALIKGSEYGQSIVDTLNRDNIKSGKYDTAWAENIGTRRLNADVYNKAAYDLAQKAAEAMEAAEKKAVAESKADFENEAGAKFKASESGKTTYTDAKGNVKEVAVKKIASTDGDVKVELDDGTVVKASDLTFGTKEEAMMYEMVARMEASPETANEIIGTFKPSNLGQASKFLTTVPLAYQYGKMGYEAGLKNIDIHDSLKKIVYNRGRMDAVAQDKVNTKKGGVKGVTKKGGIIYEGGFVYSESAATDIQKASMGYIQAIEKMSSGLEVHVFASEVKDGKRVYKVDGEYVPAPNGYFVDGNKIYIDINAGNGGEGAMLYTAAHEIAHYIREWNAKGFRELGDFLLQEYGKRGVPVEILLRDQKTKIKERYKREGTPLPSEAKLADMAYEELVADAMSEMLADERAYEKLAKLKQKDRTLWQKLGEAIKAVLDKLKGALDIYSKYAPDSEEADFVRGFDKKTFEKLQDLYIKAFVEADNNYSKAEKTLADNGIAVNPDTNSASLLSVRDVLDDDQRKKVAKALAERFGVTQAEAMDWLKAETSMASLILNPKYSQYLDYTADANEEAIKSNSDYPQGTVDFSNICKKRRDFTEVMNRILRNYPNHVFTATDLAKIRTIMEEEGMEVACAICYVEDRRQLDGPVAQDFIDSLALYRAGSKTRPDGKPFNSNQLKAFKLIEGDTYTPSIYELISLTGRNELKAKNPAMEEAWVKFNNARGMQSVRLLLNDAEYKRQILKYNNNTVKSKNDNGGLRIYSFSDMEMFHLIDIIQVITDSAAVGLSIQGYTKVNEYAKAVKDTGEKLNRSLIPKGDLGYHMENGEVILDFDTVEGIDINHPDFFDSTDNPNVGNIVIGINPTQIKAAMKSKFIDYIIPFHTGQSKEVLGEKGIAEWINYKDSQTEKDLATGKTSKHQINIYTEVIQAAEQEGKPIKNKVDFVNKFLAVCKENNLIPRFSEFLNMDENGDYVYTEGYHKFLVDFKTFDTNTGEYLPQMPVKPIFDNEYLTGLLKDYVKSQKVKDADFAEKAPKVLERITKEIVKDDNSDIRYSERDPSSISNRNLLANALESVAQNDIEKSKLEQYKSKIALIEAEQQKLAEIRAEANKLRFTKGRTPEQTKRLKDLDIEANKIANRINTYDKQLINLEATVALKNVLEREKTKLRKRLNQKNREAIRESTEGRHKTEVRHKIQRLARDLDTLLNKGTKERNVKNGEAAIVRRALDLSDMLFATDDELLLRGLEVDLSDKESDAINAYMPLYEEYHSYDDSVTEHKDERKELRSQMNAVKKQLKEALERERKRISKAKAAATFDALIAEYEKLASAKEDHLRLAYKPEVLEHIKALRDNVGENTLVSEMTLEQLVDVYKAFRMIYTMISDSNKLFRNGKKEDREARKRAIFDQVGALENRFAKDYPDAIGKALNKLNEFGWNNLRPVDAFELIGSESLGELFWDVIDAQSVYARDIDEAREAIVKARQKYGYKDWNLNKTKSFETADGRTFTVTLGEMMSIYAYSKRAQADGHMREGGFQHVKGATYKDDKGVVRLRASEALTYRVDDFMRLEIIKSLTKEQQDYATEIQKLLTSWGEKGNEASRILYGIDLFNEEVYFPLKSSHDYLTSVQTELGQTATTASLAGSGMAKPTKPNANNPIMLQAFDDVVLDHLDRMSKYHAYVVPIDNLRKMLDAQGMSSNDDMMSLKALIGEKLGSGAKEYLQNYITDLNGSASVSGAKNPLESFFGKAKGASVAANLSVWVQQYFSVIRAFSVVNPKYFIPFMGEKHTDGDMKAYEEMKKYAPITTIKEMGGFDVGSNKGINDYIGYEEAKISKGKVSKTMQDAFGIGASLMDKLGWTTIWKGVKKEIAASGKYEAGSKEYFEACGKRFEEVIVKTQVYDSVNARSGFMRSKSGTVKYLVSFMGEPTTIVGMAEVAVIKLERAIRSKDKAAIKRASAALAATMSSVAVATAMTSIAKSLVYAMRDDDEDETYLEKYAAALASAFKDDLNLLKYLPVARDIASIIEGRTIERPDMTLIEDAIDSSLDLWESLNDEDALAEDKLRDGINLAGAITNIFGIPAKNIWRDMSGLVKTILNAGSGYDTKFGQSFSEGWTGDEAKKGDNLYSAIVSGDASRVRYYKSTYKTAEAYASALRKALRENDARIKAAARARYDGDISEYKRIAKAIIAEGYFSQDDVVAAINAEVNAIKNGATVETDATEAFDEVTSIFKASDVNAAFDNGDTETALEIIRELIEVKVTNGVDEKSARSSVKSSVTAYWKPLYREAYKSGDAKEMYRIRAILLSSGLYGNDNDVKKTVKDWLKT